jgi:predicted GIY-YIG superfamily endonuclease
MLECRDGALYVGQTDDLERRMIEHDSGQCAGFTSARLPVRLAWSQEFPSRLEAREREHQIKNWSRAKKEALARGDWDEVSRRARGRDRET